MTDTQDSTLRIHTPHSGFNLHTQDSPIQIPWVLSVECWVSVISVGPGLVHIWQHKAEIFAFIYGLTKF